jgi:hypothetical protein
MYLQQHTAASCTGCFSTYDHNHQLSKRILHMELILDAIDLIDFSATLVEPIDFAAAELRLAALVLQEI